MPRMMFVPQQADQACVVTLIQVNAAGVTPWQIAGFRGEQALCQPISTS